VAAFMGLKEVTGLGSRRRKKPAGVSRLNVAAKTELGRGGPWPASRLI
jgi:hypothetical protein